MAKMKGTPKKLLPFVDYQQASPESRISRNQELEAPAYKLYHQFSLPRTEKAGPGNLTETDNTSKGTSPILRHQLAFDGQSSSPNSGTFDNLMPQPGAIAEEQDYTELVFEATKATEKSPFETTRHIQVGSESLEFQTVEKSVEICAVSLKVNVDKNSEIREEVITTSEGDKNNLVFEKRNKMPAQKKGHSPKTPPRGSTTQKGKDSTFGIRTFLSERLAVRISEKRRKREKLETEVKEMKRMREEAFLLEEEKKRKIERLELDFCIWEKIAADSEKQAREAKQKLEEEKEKKLEKIQEIEKEIGEKIEEVSKKSEGLEERIVDLTKESKELKDLEKNEESTIAILEQKLVEEANNLLSSFQNVS